MNKSPIKCILDAVFYLIAFILLEAVVQFAAGIVWYLATGLDIQSAFHHMKSGHIAGHGLAMAVVTAAASIVTILVFALCRWSPFSRVYIRKRPWATLFWVVLLTIGTIIPSAYLQEWLNVDMSKELKDQFNAILSHPVGYLSLGILVPVAEEMVFRGAILRTLLNAFSRQWHWLPIILSALVFGAVHGNDAQFVHATLLGLLLGWLYYRTDSIVPGIVLHWVNNSVAYVLTNVMPQASDAKLIELFGTDRNVLLAVAFSFCILLPSLYQVAVRAKR